MIRQTFLASILCGEDATPTNKLETLLLYYYDCKQMATLMRSFCYYNFNDIDIQPTDIFRLVFTLFDDTDGCIKIEFHKFDSIIKTLGGDLLAYINNNIEADVCVLLNIKSISDIYIYKLMNFGTSIHRLYSINKQLYCMWTKLFETKSKRLCSFYESTPLYIDHEYLYFPTDSNRSKIEFIQLYAGGLFNLPYSVINSLENNEGVLYQIPHGVDMNTLKKLIDNNYPLFLKTVKALKKIL